MYSPDERRAIRAEMNRDAMPTKEEAAAEHRSYLAREGCQKCDEDDPDALDIYGILMPSCSAVQPPRDPRVVLCDDCAENRDTLRERALKKARNRDDTLAVAIFECENWEYVTAPEQVTDKHGNPLPMSHVPTAPIECRCGAHLDEVVHLGGDD